MIQWFCPSELYRAEQQPRKWQKRNCGADEVNDDKGFSTCTWWTLTAGYVTNSHYQIEPPIHFLMGILDFRSAFASGQRISNSHIRTPHISYFAFRVEGHWSAMFASSYHTNRIWDEYWTTKWNAHKSKWLDGRTGGWGNGWPDGGERAHGRTCEWMDGRSD